jgi:hypothetical protein
MKKVTPEKGPFTKTPHTTMDHNKVSSKKVPVVGNVNSGDGKSWNFPTGKKSQNDKPDGTG